MKPFPYKIEDVNEKHPFQLAEDKLIRIYGPEGAVYEIQDSFKHFAQKFYNFKIRKSDIFVCGYPRSGTTLTEELVWLLCNNLDFEKGEKLGPNERAYYYEIDLTISKKHEKVLRVEQDDAKGRKSIRFEDFDKLPEPRVFKTHLPLPLLPPDLLTSGCKIISVARNPKDVMVSFYHFSQRFSYREAYKWDFETYVRHLIEGTPLFFPYWASISEFWKNRNSPNLLFIFYEDYIKDLRGMIEKISKFIDKHLNSEQLDLMENNLKFENFKKYFHERGLLIKKGDENDGHLRKGQFGQSQEYFKGELKTKVDAWISENVKRIGIEFSYLD